MNPEQFYAEPSRGRFGVLTPETLHRMAPPIGMWPAAPVAVCSVCGETFGLLASSHRFCSAYCRNLAYRRRRRAVGDFEGAACCQTCGRSASAHGTRMCYRCRRERKQAKRETILRMWAEGERRRVIAAAVGWSPKMVSVEIAKMRGEGIAVPYRQPAKARRSAAVGRGA